jgi:hypothetical protein
MCAPMRAPEPLRRKPAAGLLSTMRSAASMTTTGSRIVSITCSLAKGTMSRNLWRKSTHAAAAPLTAKEKGVMSKPGEGFSPDRYRMLPIHGAAAATIMAKDALR